MFVFIGRQYVNMHNVTTVDEGTGGQLRLNLADGKTVYARQTEEIAQVQGALNQLAYVPKMDSPTPEKKLTPKKVARDE